MNEYLFVSSFTESNGSLNTNKSTVTLQAIKNLFDKEKQRKLSLLIEYFENNNNQNIADSLKFRGIPYDIYVHPKSEKTAKDSFSWMGIDVVKHHLLEPNQIIFSWAENRFK
jgi:RNase P/RNase MRP subunit p30